MPSHLLAIDWDHHTLRIVHAAVRRGLRIEQALSVLLTDDVDIDRPASLGPHIARVLSEQRIVTRHAVVDLPRDQVVLLRVRLPPTPEIDLAYSVLYRVGRELPFPIDEAIVDFVVTGRDASGLATEAIAAGVRRELLDRVVATCAAAGLTLLRVGLRPFANLVAARFGSPVPEDHHSLFIDAGPELTEINVFRGPSLIFSRSASVSIPVMPHDEQLSVEAGGALPGSHVPALEEVLKEVALSVQAFVNTEPAKPAFADAIIAGGTGIEPALRASLAGRVNGPIYLFDPSAQLNLEPKVGQTLRAFSAALGLALSGTQASREQIDFLSPKQVDQFRARKRSQRRIAAMVGVLAAVVVVALPMQSRMEIERENAVVSKEVEQASKELGDLKRFNREAAQLFAWAELRVAALDEIQRLHYLLPDPAVMYLDAIIFSTTPEPTLELRGRARSHDDVFLLTQNAARSARLRLRSVPLIDSSDQDRHPLHPAGFKLTFQLRGAMLDAEALRSGRADFLLEMPELPARSTASTAGQPMARASSETASRPDPRRPPAIPRGPAPRPERTQRPVSEPPRAPAARPEQPDQAARPPITPQAADSDASVATAAAPKTPRVLLVTADGPTQEGPAGGSSAVTAKPSAPGAAAPNRPTGTVSPPSSPPAAQPVLVVPRPAPVIGQPDETGVVVHGVLGDQPLYFFKSEAASDRVKLIMQRQGISLEEAMIAVLQHDRSALANYGSPASNTWRGIRLRTMSREDADNRLAELMEEHHELSEDEAVLQVSREDREQDRRNRGPSGSGRN